MNKLYHIDTTVIYLETNPGDGGLFCPPQPVDDYREWLDQRYSACQYQDGDNRLCFGVAQRLNQVVKAQQNGATVFALGPYKTELQAVLEQLQLTGNVDEVLG